MPKNEKQKTLSTDDTTVKSSTQRRKSTLKTSFKNNQRFISSTLILVLILLAVFSLGTLKKNDSKPTAATSNSSTPSDASTPTIDPAHRFATACYEFEMPSPHDPIPTDGHCDALGQTYGEKMSSTFSIIPIGKGANLPEIRQQWINSRKDINITAETPLKLDGVDATKITYNATSGEYTKDHVVVIVATTGLQYKNLGQEVRGFVLAGLYDKARPESVAGYDKIIATWNWR